MRVVSLLPAATEMLYALGVDPVAVSCECDYPPAAREKPAANRTRVEGGSSAEINEQVAAAQGEGGVYELDRETLRAADPDLVLTQGMCEVCAVDDTTVRAALDDLGLDPEVVTTHPHSLGDVLDDVERVGAAVGREERARELLADLEARIDAVEAATPDAGPRVAVLDWPDPVMIAGHWIPGMVAAAGGRYGMADPGERSRPREWAAVREYDPEVLVVAPCGFDLADARSSAAALADRPGWADLAAVREGRAYAMDGSAYLNRPGPRLVDSLEHLAGLLHPDRLDAPPADVARPLPGALV